MDPFFFLCPTPSGAMPVRVHLFLVALWVDFTLIPKHLVVLSPAGRTHPLTLSLHVATCATHLLKTFGLDVERTIWIEHTPARHGLIGAYSETFERVHLIWNGLEFTAPYCERLPHASFDTLLSTPHLASPS